MTLEEQIKKVQEEIEWLERARNKLLQQVSFPIVVTRTGSFPEKNPAENPEIRARIEKLDGLIAEWKARLAQLHEAKLAQIEADQPGQPQSADVAEGGVQEGDTSQGGHGDNAVFRKKGNFWEVEYHGEVDYIKDSQGMRFIARLLGCPGQERFTSLSVFA